MIPYAPYAISASLSPYILLLDLLLAGCILYLVAMIAGEHGRARQAAAASLTRRALRRRLLALAPRGQTPASRPHAGAVTRSG